MFHGKKIFLYGCGRVAEYFLNKHGSDYRIAGIIDSNKEKQGVAVRELLWIRGDVVLEQNMVKSMEDLASFAGDNVVVFVTVMNHYEPIIEQLKSNGISGVFSIVHMLGREKLQQELAQFQQEKKEYYLQLPIAKKKIIFYTMGGFSGHGKALVEELLKTRTDLDIVWAVKDKDVLVPKGVRTVYMNHKHQYMCEMSTAKFWVHDYLIPSGITKKKEQIFIEIKHWSSITLKIFGFMLYEFWNDAAGIKRCEYNAQIMDYILVGSKFDEETCRRGFGFKGEVKYVGSPRSDVLFHAEKIKNKIYEHFQIDNSHKLVLFAPTFRCNEERVDGLGESVNLDFSGLKNALEEKFGGMWKILLRLHPNVAKFSNQVEREEFVIDASTYSDSQELVAASDIVITDYSSIMFEPAFVKKPVFLFATDRTAYTSEERGFLLEYDALPFPVAESNDELQNSIRCFEQSSYEQELDAFFKKYDIHEDGHASERAAQFLSELVDSEERKSRHV